MWWVSQRTAGMRQWGFWQMRWETIDFQWLLGAGVAVGAVVAGHGEAEFREAGVDKLADVDTFAVSVGDGAVVM